MKITIAATAFAILSAFPVQAQSIPSALKAEAACTVSTLPTWMGGGGRTDQIVMPSWMPGGPWRRVDQGFSDCMPMSSNPWR